MSRLKKIIDENMVGLFALGTILIYGTIGIDAYMNYNSLGWYKIRRPEISIENKSDRQTKGPESNDRPYRMFNH